jgi:hypoxanthine-guanine phosphoribosyltransferase
MSLAETESGLAVVRPEVVVSQQEYAAFVGEIALVIASPGSAYPTETTEFRGLLDGGAMFTVDLAKRIHEVDGDYHPKTGFVAVGAYGDGREARTPYIDYAKPLSIKGGKVVLLDELEETGRQATVVAEHYLAAGAAEVELIVVATKGLAEARQRFPGKVIAGKQVPEVWLRGLGLNSGPGYRWQSFMDVEK